jgi:circadian clock protein KaiB
MKKIPGATQSPGAAGADDADFVDLRLYVTDRTPRCLTVYANIKKICEAYSPDKYRIAVIDLHKSPDLAHSENITAVPTLIRVPRTPGSRRIIGMLTDTKKVLEELDLTGNEEEFRNTGDYNKHRTITR